MRRFIDSEVGATAVFVAALMMLFLSILAWAIDGGLAYDERRDTQSAADMAALAAAFAGPDCENQDWQAAGAEAAEENGFVNDGVTANVTVTNLAPSPGFGPFHARVESIQNTFFASALGTGTSTVASEATASCVKKSGLGDYAVFAAATNCPPNELKINASGMTIDGGVHSNDDLLLTAQAANPGYVDGDITWVDNANISNVTAINGGSAYQWDVAANGYPPTPGGWDIDDYRPTAGPVPPLSGPNNQGSAGYYYYPSGATLSGPLADGIYFAEGDLVLQAFSANAATFVATGQIEIKGVANVLTSPFDSTGLGVFSDFPGVPKCTGLDLAINWSGSSHTWSGAQYAPNGLIDMSGASNSSVNGSIIAYRIDLSGANIAITYDNSFTGVPVTSLRLEK
ncbi:MAG: pilus assembly protein TadG-related protein [Acidimicrobiia bacterium]|nr:pilus assembly protein TadG-related protein [Acidimicrobiia bacterium]MDH5504002.1 pilus assembly protein TadG-related protein [Acidimicrobiia bacterium]